MQIGLWEIPFRPYIFTGMQARRDGCTITLDAVTPENELSSELCTLCRYAYPEQPPGAVEPAQLRAPHHLQQHPELRGLVQRAVCGPRGPGLERGGGDPGYPEVAAGEKRI
jgi:hypothetical protein